MSDSSQNKGKKRTKAYYLKCAKQGRHKPCMEAGQKGFLVTCNNRERECTRESYSILNQYADKLYGPETTGEIEEEPNPLDIEEQVKQEIENIKNSMQTERRFQALDSGARNCIFIRAKVPDPAHLIHAILTDVLITQRQCSRYILRITPVLSICRANLEDIKSCAEKLFPKYFEETGLDGKTYAIIFKARNNSTVSRNDVIPALGAIICRLNKSNKADLSSPNLTVLVDVIGKFCCLGIAEGYYSLKKYNLAELTVKEKSTSNEPETTVVKEENDEQTHEDEPALSNQTDPDVKVENGEG